MQLPAASNVASYTLHLADRSCGQLALHAPSLYNQNRVFPEGDGIQNPSGHPDGFWGGGSRLVRLHPLNTNKKQVVVSGLITARTRSAPRSGGDEARAFRAEAKRR